MDLSSEEEVKKALKCNREYMGEGVSDISEGGPCVVSHIAAGIVLGPGDPAGSPQSLPLEQPQSEHRESHGRRGRMMRLVWCVERGTLCGPAL